MFGFNVIGGYGLVRRGNTLQFGGNVTSNAGTIGISRVRRNINQLHAIYLAIVVDIAFKDQLRGRNIHDSRRHPSVG